MSAANVWDVELITRREIPYLQATMYYYVYHINTIAFYWQEKPTLSMNENRRISSFRVKIVQCVGAKAKDKKSALNHDYKNNDGRYFQFTKLSFIDFVPTDRRNPSGNRQKLACGKSFICRFSFSAAEKRHYQSHWIRSLRFFFSYVGFLQGRFERHRLWAIWIFQCFSGRNPREWWSWCFVNMTE